MICFSFMTLDVSGSRVPHRVPHSMPTSQACSSLPCAAFVQRMFGLGSKNILAGFETLQRSLSIFTSFGFFLAFVVWPFQHVTGKDEALIARSFGRYWQREAWTSKSLHVWKWEALTWLYLACFFSDFVNIFRYGK